MNRIRVLRVISRMNVGGPALQVAGLADGLDPARFDHRLLVGSVGPGEADYLDLRAPHVPAVRIPGLGRSPRAGGEVRALAALVTEIRRFRPHIVHTHTAKAGALGRVAAMAQRVPVRVHTFHGHLLHGYFSPRTTRAVVAAERTLARATTRLVAVGERVRDELLEAGVGRPEQYVVVPPGIAARATPARHEARRALGLDVARPTVAFVGRLAPVKRADRFADVVRIVARRRPDCVFVVAGEGSDLEMLAATARRDGLPVVFLGWRPDVETVFGAADLTLLTSDNEGMPVSLIEAAWAGCPAVATDVGSVAEVVIHERTGIVTGPSPEELAGAVLRLIGDEKLRSAMARASREQATERFGVERLVRDITTLYEELSNHAR